MTDDGVLDRQALDLAPRGLFLGGRFEGRAKALDVEDPSTGSVLASVADAGREDAVAALDAAVEAAAGWAATAPRERAEVLRRAYDATTAAAEPLARLMTLEMGKPLADSRAEVAYGAEFLRWFSEEAVRLDGHYQVAPDGGSRLLTLQRPVGPCLLITPWNFPLAMATRKIGPALASGCTCVVKPAQQTPLTMLAFAQILQGAGLPDGVVNIVVTSSAADVSGPLLADPRLRKLSFTGSTAVGRSLGALAAERALKVSLELGGNAPFLVFGDADLDRALQAAVLAKMRNVGQACTAANRFLVHESVAGPFTEALAGRLGAMKVGRGTEEGVEVGPLVEERAVAKVEDLVRDALDRGATAVLPGGRLDRAGHFWAPTVLADVPPGARLLAEEVFGPVAPVTTFSTEEEAIALANDTEFGLVAYACTRDLARTLRLSEALEVGMLGINTGIVSNPAAPFGGVKQSGYGREGGAEGVSEYVQPRYVNLPAG